MELIIFFVIQFKHTVEFVITCVELV